MNLGAMSSMYSYVGITSERYLEIFAQFNLGYIDIMTVGDLQTRYLNPEAVERLQNNITKLKLIPSCLIANVKGNGASSNEEFRNKTAEAVIQVIRIASQVGFPIVHLNLGEKEVGISHQQAWDNMKMYIWRCLECAEKERIILSFESNPRIFRMVNSTDEVARLLKEISSPYFKATVDIGHMTICREDPSEILKLKGQIIHAHITDNDGTSDTNETLGTGITPIAECLEKLYLAGIDDTARQCGFEPVAVIEIGSPDKLSLRSVDNILARSLEYLKKIASPYLQGV